MWNVSYQRKKYTKRLSRKDGFLNITSCRYLNTYYSYVQSNFKNKTLKSSAFSCPTPPHTIQSFLQYQVQIYFHPFRYIVISSFRAKGWEKMVYRRILGRQQEEVTMELLSSIECKFEFESSNSVMESFRFFEYFVWFATSGLNFFTGVVDFTALRLEAFFSFNFKALNASVRRGNFCSSLMVWRRRLRSMLAVLMDEWILTQLLPSFFNSSILLYPVIFICTADLGCFVVSYSWTSIENSEWWSHSIDIGGPFDTDLIERWKMREIITCF